MVKHIRQVLTYHGYFKASVKIFDDIQTAKHRLGADIYSADE